MTPEIDDAYKVHRLNAEGIALAEQLAVEFTKLTRLVEKMAGTSTSRELSIVKTKLQEGCFFAKRAMAMNPANQETK